MDFSTSISRKYQTDILVIGIGSAGSVTAIAGAQGKHEVTLVERYEFEGGS